jgi:ABC-type multidrug transport system permease subunit
MLTFMSTIGLFQLERPVFLREQSSAMYDVLPYFNAKTLAESPLLTITPLVFSIIVYFGVGFNWTASCFFMFFFSLWCLVMCAVSLGYFVSSLFSNYAIAAMIAPILMMPFMLFSGFYANFKTMADWISWF